MRMWRCKIRTGNNLHRGSKGINKFTWENCLKGEKDQRQCWENTFLQSNPAVLIASETRESWLLVS